MKGNGTRSELELVPLNELKPHPRNYRDHPDEQIRHLVESLREHGVYRNVVIARDGTILAGHGVVKAAREFGLERIPARRLDLAPDEPSALKVLAADNEIAGLAEQDDRALADLLHELDETAGVDLLGTGFDNMMLANLVLVTRAEGEIEDMDAAREWANAGMPGFDSGVAPPKVVVSFRSEDDREKFMRHINVSTIIRKELSGKTWSIWWPDKGKETIPHRYEAE